MAVANNFSRNTTVQKKNWTTDNKDSNLELPQAAAKRRAKLARYATHPSGKARPTSKVTDVFTGNVATATADAGAPAPLLHTGRAAAVARAPGTQAAPGAKAPPQLPPTSPNYAVEPSFDRSSKLYLSRVILAGGKAASYRGLQGLYVAIHAGLPLVCGVVGAVSYVAARASGAAFGTLRAAGIRETMAEHVAVAQKLTRQIALVIAHLLVAAYFVVAEILLASLWLLSLPLSVAAMPVIKLYDHYHAPTSLKAA